MNVRKLIVASMMMGAMTAQMLVFADDTTVVVQPPPPSPPPEPPPTPPRERLFPSNQLNLDLFGTYADRNRFGNSVNHGGGGVGLDYFFTRYLGIGADSYLEEWKWPYRLNGSAIVRLPLPRPLHGLALYGFGGGGREFKYVAQYTWHGGGGVEWKLTRRFGLFGDVREVLPDRTPNYTLARAGVSFGF